jgi:O-6-methylguanine DNA methyltransferase
MKRADSRECGNVYVDSISESPGPFTFAVHEDGALLWLQFLDGHYPNTIEEELTHLGHKPGIDLLKTARARNELLEYCRGERLTFTLPFKMHGTAWQETVWRSLTEIPFGETRSYGQIAARLNRPGAARAMGRANALNPICIVVPCHRVIGADGKLTGYDGGVHLKARLLTHEANVIHERRCGRKQL